VVTLKPEEANERRKTNPSRKDLKRGRKPTEILGRGEEEKYLSSLQAENRGVSIERNIIEWLKKRSETGK
jgi:hypothetical protein